MDAYIAAFLCSEFERRQDLHLLILGNERMNFESKRQVFLQIIKKYNHKIFVEHPDIAKDIEKIIQERNILAHYLLDFGEEAMALPKGTIRFHKIKNDHTYLVYTGDDIERLYNKIEAILDIIASYFNPV
jgi:hypothetical protein